MSRINEVTVDFITDYGYAVFQAESSEGYQLFLRPTPPYSIVRASQDE